MKKTLLNYLAYSDFGQMTVSIVAIHSAQDDIQSQDFFKKVFIALHDSKICASDCAISPTHALCEKNGAMYRTGENYSLSELQTQFSEIDWGRDVELWAYNLGLQFILNDHKPISDEEFQNLKSLMGELNIIKL